MKIKHRFIEFNDELYIVVGQGKTDTHFPGDYFEAVRIEDHDGRYNRAALSVLTEKIFVEDCQEITDKRKLRIIELLYG